MADSNDELLKFELPEIIYGLGSLAQIGQCARRLGGERILLVTDPGLTVAGWVDKSRKYLKQEGLKCVVYDNVITNPRCYQVEQGAQIYTQNECDVIIGLGGGSPMDTAKGIAILVSNHGCIHDYVGCNLITQPIPPLICVPTTAGTGSDVSQFSVIADPRTKIKMTILSRAIMPDISLIDPLLLSTKTEELMATTGMDALTHAIEAYVSSLSWPLTDPHALHAVELVFQNLNPATLTKKVPALEGMAVASLEAGASFSNAILGAVHALAHPLGGLYDMHHGLANAVLLPVVLKKNIEYAPDKYVRVANAMGIDTRDRTDADIIQELPFRIEKLIASLQIPTRLSQLGVDRKDIPRMAAEAVDDLCMQTNPHCYAVDEIIALYNDAY